VLLKRKMSRQHNPAHRHPDKDQLLRIKTLTIEAIFELIFQ